MKTALLALVLLFLPTSLLPQTKPSYGWLPPGTSYAEFAHRVANIKEVDPFLDKIFRGRFLFHLSKPIYRSENFEASVLIEPQLLFGGFHERRILLPAFSFRGEIIFSWRLSQEGLWINLSNLHYSTHIMDRIPINSPAEALAASKINLGIDDVNLIRFGISWFNNINSWLADNLSVTGGMQPWRLNYWLITEADLMFQKTSYQPYTRRFYFGFSLDKKINQNHTLTLKYFGETERTIRNTVELIYAWQSGFNEETINLFLRYEGAHIKANEVVLTSHGGVARRWLLLGLRLYM